MLLYSELEGVSLKNLKNERITFDFSVFVCELLISMLRTMLLYKT